MSEINNMFLPNEEIYSSFKDYIESKVDYEIWVGRNKIKGQEIAIVFEESKNVLQSHSTTYDNTIRALSYNVDIYCTEKENSYEIVKELSILTIEFMQGIYKMNGGLNAIIPLFDNKNHTSYQATLRFTTNFKPNENKLI